MEFALPADADGSTGPSTQQDAEHNHAVDPAPGWSGTAAKYHPSHRPRPAASLHGREVTGMTATGRSR